MGKAKTGINARIGWAPLLDEDNDTYGPEIALSDCASWTLNPTSDKQSYRSCNTGGSKRNVFDGLDGSGSVVFFITENDPPYEHLREGRSGKFFLYEQDNHIDATITPRFWTVPAYIDDVDTGADVDGGGFIQFTANFSPDGVILDPLGGAGGPAV